MVVKSSTKKRLVELGVSEEHAHKLADDANMDAIKQMSVEDVANKIGIDSETKLNVTKCFYYLELDLLFDCFLKFQYFYFVFVFRLYLL